MTLADVARRITTENDIKTELLSSRPSVGYVKFPPKQASTLTKACTNRRDMETSRPISMSVMHVSSQSQAPTVQSTEHKDNGFVTQQPAARNHYVETFGRLPVTTVLHKQLGKFDGQDVFTGHQKHDISVHQWEASPFQWVDTSRYAHARGRIEGSLAFDGPDGDVNLHETLRPFREAAETGERSPIKTCTARRKVVEANQPMAEMACQELNLVKVAEGAAQSRVDEMWNTKSSALFKDMATEARSSLHDQGTYDCSHDPFSTDKVSTHALPGDHLTDARESLNNEHQCSNGSFSSSSVNPTFFTTMAGMLRHSEQGVLLDSRPSERLAQANLQSLLTKHEPPGGFMNSTGQGFSSHHLPKSAAQTVPSRCLDPEAPRLVGVKRVRRSSGSAQDLTNTTYGVLQPTVRSLFPPLGPSIANPHRSGASDITVTVNLSEGSQCKGYKDCEPVVADLITSGTRLLRSSESENMRADQDYAIADRLSKQGPTMQGFKGPFFTASKPTANDPTISLSIDISEKDRLSSWFSDGQRPARQREYAMTLVAAAITHARWSRDVGDINRAGQVNKSANTTLFVRLYESLSEYIEERRSESDKSYFNRTWNTSPSHFRTLRATDVHSVHIGSTDGAPSH